MAKESSQKPANDSALEFEAQLWAEEHIFYRSLRGGRLDFGPFNEKLGRPFGGEG